MEIESFIEIALDDNPNKVGKYLAIGKIPIKSSNAMQDENIKTCLLGLNSSHHDKIRNNHKIFIDGGGTFFSIFPETKGYIEDSKL